MCFTYQAVHMVKDLDADVIFASMILWIFNSDSRLSDAVYSIATHPRIIHYVREFTRKTNIQ
jgi:hypothetical protein